ncbi:MAG: beta-lactamase family protein [Ignavibacteriales bacterium]|nr:beta-lactamase family protein [Ignavibacteriales bacterium]
MKKIFPFIIVFTIFTATSCENLLLDYEAIKAPSPKDYESKFATLLDSLRYALDLPALAAAIVTDTGIVEARAVGCRRYGGEANVTNTDRFHLGSCGKSFTSVLIGVLVDEGMLEWNTTLPEIFPEYANMMRAEYKNVTVKDILSHSAGFVRDADNNFNKTNTRERRIEALEWALQQPPAQQRGKFLYSNLGFTIAGAVAEKLTNRNYEELLMERVIKQLGITTAGFGAMGIEGKEDQPLQHTPSHAHLTAIADAGLDPVYNPAGGLHMSVGDWGKYIQWTLTIEAGGHQTLLRDETAKMITAPAVDQGGGWSYSLGWGVGDASWAEGKSLNHSGSNGFNYSTALLASKKHYGIIVMTNQGAVGAEWPLDKVFWRVLDYYQKGR